MSRKKTLKDTKTFYFPITKEIVRRNGEENKKTISYKFQFLHYIGFVKGSLSNLADNLADGIHKTTCKYGLDNKKCNTNGIKHKHCCRE